MKSWRLGWRASVHYPTWPRSWSRRIALCAALLVRSSGATEAMLPASAPVSATRADEPVRIWYRSSAGCPDGSAFIGSLQRLGRRVSIAGAGDRIDFVVNLAFAERESSGRLERQSSAGTVAIRDVVAPSCEEVAEVLALTLDLTLQPRFGDAPSAPSEPGWALGFGAQGTFETGLARAFLPGAAAFLETGPLPRVWSLRLSLRGAVAERASSATMHVRLLASRAEACGWWMLEKIALAACGGVDLGAVEADSSGDRGRSDTGMWASAVAHGRGSWQLGRVVALEAQFGVLAPFVRYRFSARTGETLTDSATLGLQTALGVSFRL